MDHESKPKPLHENLDTAFVNLWSLLRNLTQKGFVGRVHVDLKDYAADIFMDGSSTPVVREIDRAAGTETFGEAELHRVVLRARETPGKISVFEGAGEAVAAKTRAPETQATPQSSEIGVRSAEPVANPIADYRPATEETASESRETLPLPRQLEPEVTEDLYPTGSYQDWPAILAATGELIGAIERAINAAGENFDSGFAAVRLQLADDYSFLDPTAQNFQYESGTARLTHQPPVNVFVSGLSEALRRVIDRVAVGERSRRLRERVALEMLTVARKRAEVLERSGFQAQLDRIAGTRVK